MRKTCLILILSVLACPVVANAFAIFTYGFTDVSSSFDGATTWTMTADANTGGDVTRTVSPVGTAQFSPDFTGGFASFDLSMEVAPLDATHYDGLGEFTITDVNGDTITGELDGFWTKLSAGSYFSGDLFNVTLNELGDGVFSGPSGGSFGMDFSPDLEPYPGGAAILTTGWFDTSFVDANAVTQGSVSNPEPASLLLLGLGSGLFFRYRR
jgi:hypothetical protein